MKKIILMITGSIAAPKALTLYHLLKQKYQITVLFTPSASKFVKFPENIKVYSEFLEQDFYHKIDLISHTDFALSNDLIIVYPATMTFISKAALAICDNLALATFLASPAKKIIFPAMNHYMYHNQAMQNNLALLAKDPSVEIMDTDQGMLACNIIGDGRVKEPEIAFKIIENFTSAELTNKTVLINYGSARTYFDDIRYLTTHSSGKMGQAMVAAFLAKNAKVIAVVGDVSVSLIQHPNLTILRASTNQMFLSIMEQYFVKADIVVCVAALNDYQLIEKWQGKINKTEYQELQLNLVTNLDVLASLGKLKINQLLVGFSAQDNQNCEIAKNKMINKNCDGMVMNNINSMNQDQTEVTFYFKEQSYHFRGSKIKVAQEIVDVLIKYFD